MPAARRPVIARPYLSLAITLLGVATAFLLRQAMVKYIGAELPPFITFYPATMIVAILGGFWAGLVATVLSSLVAAFWIFPPQGSIEIAEPANLIALALYFCMGLFMSVVAERYRLGQLRINAYERDEAMRVGEERLQQSEETLRESEERLRLFIEHAPTALAMFDREMRFLHASRRWRSDHGLGERELAGLPYYEVDPQVPEAWREVHRRGLAGEVVVKEEDQVMRAHGVAQWLHWEVRPWYDRAGAIGGIVIFTEDITARKQSEKETARLSEQLLQAQKLESVGRLAGGIAHDFNNLLTVIGGYSDLALRRVPKEDPLRAPLTEIHKASDRAAELTQHLLAFSRKQIARPKPLSLNEVITGLRSMLERMIGEDITLETSLAPALGQVFADRNQLVQILMNLAVNARDAMPSGGTLAIETANLEVDAGSAALYPEATPGAYVTLAVRDSGIGMDEQTRQQIFEPFFTTKEVGVGTGLGLSTVYGVVRQYEGWISVNSQPGQGTEFKIFLPRAAGAVVEPEAISASADSLNGKETILVTEDREEVRTFVAETLRLYGYHVLEANHGEEALAITRRRQEPIHLLVTDVVMPGMTGKELAEHLQTLSPQTRILFMSGYTNESLFSPAGTVPENYLSKPFTPETLARKVRQLLDQRPRRRILVADDESAIRKMLQHILSDAGYEVCLAEDGQQALHIMKQQSFDILLTDLVMPNSEGIELIQAIRKEHPELRIIAMSGAFEGSFLKVAETLGADGTLAKPISEDRLFAVLGEKAAAADD